jgi:hypothetical protein
MSEMSTAEIEMLRMIGDRLKSLDERITLSDAASATSRTRMHQELEALGRTCLTIDLRVQAAEKALALASPTLQEVMDTKLKVKGGGILALGLWKLAVMSIGAVVFLYTFWDRVEAVFRALFHAPK